MTFQPRPFTPDAVMPRRRGLPDRRLDNELMVRDPENGRVHFLNPTAALIWNCCDGQQRVADCVQQIRLTFAIPASIDVMADVRTTLTELARKRLLDDGSDE